MSIKLKPARRRNSMQSHWRSATLKFSAKQGTHARDLWIQPPFMPKMASITHGHRHSYEKESRVCAKPFGHPLAAADSSVDSIAATGGESVNTYSNPAIAQRRRARIQQKTRSIFTRKSGPLPFSEQAECPLFRLPLEIREIIWEEVLTRPEDAQAAHFHVYDEVYDSCTYDPLSPAIDSWDREDGETTALLRTCHAIYDEAVQTLYDSAHFEFVILPGLARPRVIQTYHTSYQIEIRQNLQRRHCVGKLKDLTGLLKRVRRATIVVQPGGYTDISLYVKRLKAFIEAMGYGQHLRHLCLKLNFHARMDLQRNGAYTKVLAALAPLGKKEKTVVTPTNRKDRPRETTIISYAASTTAIHNNPVIAQYFTNLQQTLNVPNTQVTRCCTFGGNPDTYKICRDRGAHGQPREPPMPKADKLAVGGVLAACVLLTPITIPVAVGTVAFFVLRRKKLKGERWWTRGE